MMTMMMTTITRSQPRVMILDKSSCETRHKDQVVHGLNNQLVIITIDNHQFYKRFDD